MTGEALEPDEVGPVGVALSDNAADACWTNLREVREYAEEKLRSEGYALAGERREMLDYTLVISVNGYRSKAVPICVGSITAMVTKVTEADGILGMHVINLEDSVVTSAPNGNLNQRVIEVVQRTFDAM
jgi:hypothetical protein